MTREPIHVLPPEVASRIAAGEVIERPVSVVRELLDNAIDAGAGRIGVEVEEGGIRLIRVRDDGCGIPPNEVELAFARHATSKIRDIDDLRRVRTLGFRGEALPSIAAAADVELVTRREDSPVGVSVTLVDGRVVRRSSRPAPVGTTVTVRDLFARLPARRRFLSSPAAEARAIATLVAHYALAHPEIAFELRLNGRRSFATAGDGELLHAFAAIHGAETAGEMLPLRHDEGGIRVFGLVGSPAVHRGNRSGIATFINGRWVQSRPILYAVVDAYGGQLPTGRFPLAVVSVVLPEEEVDVNVHPAKADVRLRDERAVQRAIRHAVVEALRASPAQPWRRPTVTPPPEAMLSERLRPSLELRPEPTQVRLPLAPGAAAPPQRAVLPLLRVVGQLQQCYIVAEGPDGAYLIDQHAAHERVLYERIRRRQQEGPLAVQALLEPLVVHLTPPAAATALEHQELLRGMGILLEEFGEGAWLVREVPRGLVGTDIAGCVQELLGALAREGLLRDPFERVAATVACHASVRSGMALTMDEMRALVEELERCELPRTCPHGRPTLVHLSTAALEREFRRR